MFISGIVRLINLIEAKRQTLPEINVYTCLFGSIEYVSTKRMELLLKRDHNDLTCQIALIVL